MEEKLYELVTDEDEVLCEGIGEEACEEVPRNFGKQVLALTATKSGDQLSKPGLVLTWLLTALGAPAVVIGMLAPVRQAGSLLPQMIVSGLVRRRAIRKWFWVVGSAVQGLAVVGMGIVAWSMEGAAAGWTIVGLLAVFSLARGFCSVTSKDLLGRTIPEKRRGRLGGLASTISGWFAVAVGIFFMIRNAEELPATLFAILLFVAGGLWLVAAGVMATLREQAAETNGGDGLMRDVVDGFRVLGEDRVFLRFCLARALMASTVLSMPFYVVLAHRGTDGVLAGLGLLMLAGSLATAMSGVTWGKLSDHSSRKTMIVAGASAGLVGCLTFALSGLTMGSTAGLWTYGFLFFLIGLAHTGIRSGRKTYLVDHASADNRARLVAVSNTLMGLVLLASGSFGLLADLIGERWIVLVFALLGLAGSAVAWRLPEVHED